MRDSGILLYVLGPYEQLHVGGCPQPSERSRKLHVPLRSAQCPFRPSERSAREEDSLLEQVCRAGAKPNRIEGAIILASAEIFFILFFGCFLKGHEAFKERCNSRRESSPSDHGRSPERGRGGSAAPRAGLGAGRRTRSDTHFRLNSVATSTLAASTPKKVTEPRQSRAT